MAVLPEVGAGVVGRIDREAEDAAGTDKDSNEEG